MSRRNKQQTSVLLGALVCLVVFIGLGGWYGYAGLKHGQLATAKKSATTPTPVDASMKIKVSELGIEIPVPDSIKDLTYSIKSGKSSDGKAILSASLSTTSLNALDMACANGGLGIISRVEGQYPQGSKTIANEAGNLAKQFPRFYIGYLMPQAYCSKNQDAILLFRDQYTALATMLESIAELK